MTSGLLRVLTHFVINDEWLRIEQSRETKGQRLRQKNSEMAGLFVLGWNILDDENSQQVALKDRIIPGLFQEFGICQLLVTSQLRTKNW